MMRHLKKHKLSLYLILTLLLGLSSIIPIRLTWAKRQAPLPQAILVLEGRTERIRFAAQFAEVHDDLPIWVSGNPRGLQLNQSIFRRDDVSSNRVHYDFCGVDTVTNFTCNADDFRTLDIRHVYVVTSDYHMTRSLAIATLVFGSRGIAVTGVPVASDGDRAESPLRTVRDCIRSVVWIVTGYTGRELYRFLQRLNG